MLMLLPDTELLWVVLPPLLLLFFYYHRIPTAPSLARVLLFFLLGIVSGLFALSLEWIFENVVNLVVNWQTMQFSLLGTGLRQLLEVGPIEEGCKLLAIVVPTRYFQSQYRLRPSTVYLFTIAVALGFTTEENWIYLNNGTASIVDRVIGTPVHPILSAPWGYALGISFWLHTRLMYDRKLILSAWLNSVVCHALVNFLSGSWDYPPPIHFLSYGLFPFLLWMFWRLEQFLRKLLGKPSIKLISSRTPHHWLWQHILVLFTLILGGNAIFGLFELFKSVSLLSHLQLSESRVLLLILSRLLLNIFVGFLAWLIYRYLRHLARRRFF